MSGAVEREAPFCPRLLCHLYIRRARPLPEVSRKERRPWWRRKERRARRGTLHGEVVCCPPTAHPPPGRGGEGPGSGVAPGNQAPQRSGAAKGASLPRRGVGEARRWMRGRVIDSMLDGRARSSGSAVGREAPQRWRGGSRVCFLVGPNCAG